MQKPEKLTFSFVFKLAMLSLLLFAGVLLKQSPQNPTLVIGSDSALPKPTSTSTTSELDSLKSDQPYHKLVINQSEDVVSI